MISYNTEYVILYTDGACRIKNKITPETPSAWAYQYTYKGNAIEGSQAYFGFTNNAMEITSVIAGLHAVKDKTLPIRVFSDSAYVVNCMNSRWYDRWEASNWTKPSKLQNKDLWKALLTEVRSHSFVQFFKVKGHTDDEHNQRVDLLCNQAMDNLIASKNKDTPI